MASIPPPNSNPQQLNPQSQLLLIQQQLAQVNAQQQHLQAMQASLASQGQPVSPQLQQQMMQVQMMTQQLLTMEANIKKCLASAPTGPPPPAAAPVASIPPPGMMPQPQVTLPPSLVAQPPIGPPPAMAGQPPIGPPPAISGQPPAVGPPPAMAGQPPVVGPPPAVGPPTGFVAGRVPAVQMGGRPQVQPSLAIAGRQVTPRPVGVSPPPGTAPVVVQPTVGPPPPQGVSSPTHTVVSSPLMAHRGRGVAPAPGIAAGRGVAPSPGAPGRGIAPAPGTPGRGVAPSPAIAGRGVAPSPAIAGRGVAPSPAIAGRGVASAPAIGGRGVAPAPAIGGRGVAPAPAIGGRGVAPSPAIAGRGVAPSPAVGGRGVAPAPGTPGRGVSPAPGIGGRGVAPSPAIAGRGVVSPGAGRALPATGRGQTAGVAPGVSRPLTPPQGNPMSSAAGHPLSLANLPPPPDFDLDTSGSAAPPAVQGHVPPPAQMANPQAQQIPPPQMPGQPGQGSPLKAPIPQVPMPQVPMPQVPMPQMPMPQVPMPQMPNPQPVPSSPTPQDRPKSSIIRSSVSAPLEPPKDRYIVCRNENGELLTEGNTSIVSLLRCYDRIMHPSDQTEKDPVAFAKQTICQIIFDFTSCVLNGNFELFFSLWNEGVQLTEEFSVEIPLQPNSIRRALFKDVEINDKTMVACRVVNVVPDQHKLNIRAPYAVGVMSLKDALENGADKMVFYTGPEASLVDGCRQLTLKTPVPTLEPRAASELSICANLTKRDGLYEEVVQYAMQDAALCRVMRLGETPVPDYDRNQVFVTLKSGRFTQGKNIQITAIMRNDKGPQVPGCLSVGSLDCKLDSTYYSPVISGVQNPQWEETIRICMPPGTDLRDSHLYFTIRQISSKQDKATPFAFAFVKFTKPDGSLIDDGVLNLECYKTSSSEPMNTQYLTQVWSNNSLAASGGAPAAGAKRSESSMFIPRRNESLSIGITSFSRIPKSPQIVNLYDWKNLQLQLESVLENVVNAAATEEFVSFLPDILHVLFQILQELFQQPAPRKKCFQTIVKVLSASPLVDQKFKKYALYKAHLEGKTKEIVSSFNHVYDGLLSGIESSFQSTDPADIQLRLQTMKVLHTLFRFILSSRLVAMTGLIADPHCDEEFKATLRHFFDVFGTAVGQTDNNQAAALRGTAVKNFDQILLLMDQFFTRQELCQIFLGFLAKLRQENDDPAKKESAVSLSLKINFIYRVLDGVLPLDTETAPVFMPTLCDLISTHPMESTPLFALVVDFLLQNLEKPVFKECRTQLVPVLPQIATALKKMYRLDSPNSASAESSADSSLSRNIAQSTSKMITQTLFSKTIPEKQLLVTSFLGMLSVIQFGVLSKVAGQPKEVRVSALGLAEQAFVKVEGGNADKGFRSFMNTILGLLRAICADPELYLDSWYSMIMFKEQTSLQFLFFAKQKLLKRIDKAKPATPEGDAEMEVWESFLRLCVTLMANYKTYEWEEFPNPKLYKDCWTNSAERIIPVVQKECFPVIPRKSFFLPLIPMLLPLLVLCDQLPKIDSFVGDLYFGITSDEFCQTGKFERSAAMSCETIDAAMTDRRNGKTNVVDSQTFQRFFNEMITGRYNKEKDAVKKAGSEFLQSVLTLLQLEMEYDAIPDGGDEERAAVTMKMMNYFVSFELSRYFRYVHNLYNLHLRNDNTGELVNYAEAGTTIMLHASQLGWTDEVLPKLELGNNEAPLPAEPSWARKQRLYYLAIDAFNNAKLQERSIELLKELEIFHSMRRDFAQLAKILNDQKDAYCGIKVPSKTFSHYYLICYYGHGFTIVYSNKRFVYRADIKDTIDTVADRLRKRFTEAKIDLITDGSLDSINAEALKRSDGQEIVIACLEPSSEQETRGEQRVFPKKMPEVLKEYHRYNNTDVFSFTDKNGKQTFFFTEEKFPGTRRRLEVIKEISKK